MNMRLLPRPKLWRLVMWTLLPFALSNCGGTPPIIRGSSEVLKLQDGAVVVVPAGWEPRIVYGLSPVAMEELLRCCGEKTK